VKAGLDNSASTAKNVGRRKDLVSLMNLRDLEDDAQIVAAVGLRARALSTTTAGAGAASQAAAAASTAAAGAAAGANLEESSDDDMEARGVASVGPGRYCSPLQQMALNSRHWRSKCVG